jgi:hypothetical protein
VTRPAWSTTVLHIGENELVHALLGAQRTAALTGERFVCDHELRQPAGHSGSGEVPNREQPGLQEVAGRRIEHQHPVALFDQHGDGGERSVKVGEPSWRDERGPGQRDQQHYAQAAFHAAARIHEERDCRNVCEHMQAQLDVEAVTQQEHRRLEDAGREEIRAAGIEEDGEAVLAERQLIVIGQRRTQEYRDNRDAVHIEVLERNPERLGHAVGERLVKGAGHRCHVYLAPSLKCSGLQK